MALPRPKILHFHRYNDGSFILLSLEILIRFQRIYIIIVFLVELTSNMQNVHIKFNTIQAKYKKKTGFCRIDKTPRLGKLHFETSQRRCC